MRGRVLAVPAGIRPTSGRVRGSLMDIWRPRLVGAHFLDLFSGTGAVGIEAVSRGASQSVLVESDPLVIVQLTENCRLAETPEVRIVAATVPTELDRRLSRLPGGFDLIFADPPYAFDAYTELLSALDDRLAPSGEIAIEHESRREVAVACGRLLQVDRRRYGDTCLSFYRRESAPQE